MYGIKFNYEILIFSLLNVTKIMNKKMLLHYKEAKMNIAI
jgi:hypothetical protein